MVKTRSGPPPSPPPSLNARIMESSSVKDSECFLQNQKVVVAEEAGGKNQFILTVFHLGATAFSDMIRCLEIAF